MENSIPLRVFFLILTLSQAQIFEVQNVTASQRTDGSHILDVCYDLSPDDLFISFRVTAEINIDGSEDNWMYLSLPVIENVYVTNIHEELNKLDLLRESSAPKNFVDLLDLMIFRKYGGDDTQAFEIRSWAQVLMGNIASSEYSYDQDPDLFSKSYYNDDGLKLFEDIFQNNILVLSFHWEYFENQRKKYENIYRNGNLVMKTQWEYYGNGNYKSVNIHNLLNNKIKNKK